MDLVTHEAYLGFHIYASDQGWWAYASWDSSIQLSDWDIYHLRQMIWRWWHPEEN